MDNLVPLSDVAHQIGCHTNTARRRLQLIGAQFFVDPSDNRRRLVLREDAERLMIPQIAERPARKGAVSEAA